jgi:hypothetical protein
MLSQFTGAARELPEALIVNPYDVEAASAAMALAARMPLDELRQRMKAMRSYLSHFNVTAAGHRLARPHARTIEAAVERSLDVATPAEVRHASAFLRRVAHALRASRRILESGLTSGECRCRRFSVPGSAEHRRPTTEDRRPTTTDCAPSPSECAGSDLSERRAASPGACARIGGGPCSFTCGAPSV